MAKRECGEQCEVRATRRSHNLGEGGQIADRGVVGQPKNFEILRTAEGFSNLLLRAISLYNQRHLETNVLQELPQDVEGGDHLTAILAWREPLRIEEQIHSSHHRSFYWTGRYMGANLQTSNL